jgi:hypothetical protein
MLLEAFTSPKATLLITITAGCFKTGEITLFDLNRPDQVDFILFPWINAQILSYYPYIIYSHNNHLSQFSTPIF